MPKVTESRLEYLFRVYFDGICSQEENEELLELVHQARNDDQLKHLMEQVWSGLSPAYQLNDEQSERILAGILPSSSQKKHGRGNMRKIMFRWSAAAAVLLILLMAGWMWFGENRTGGTEANPALAEYPIKDTSTNKTILTLGNGKKIILDSSHIGLLSLQGNTKVINVNPGLLSYNQRAEASEGTPGKPVTVQYNTIATPRGSQIQIILPDGSNVWLNAASSIRFPTAFVGSERKVEVTGEAYFEIAQNKNKPFKVGLNKITVEVLGTHFNIMAYGNEPVIRTTLLEGSVKVWGNGKNVILKPGQQASLSHAANSSLEVGKADVQVAVAWKEGLFLFHDSDIRTVFREISRWYNVEVVYKGNINAHLNGMINRTAGLPEVLHMLEVTSNLTIKTEGRKVIVM